MIQLIEVLKEMLNWAIEILKWSIATVVILIVLIYALNSIYNILEVRKKIYK